ncbi:MAG: nickel-dependent lactate racemase [Deltaproteobacteria bacterium]|nr:MAG: nickel-dependent lactate racemase [Deltaproteobacteria bacterium]
MQVQMKYGKNGLPLFFPDDWDVTVIKKIGMPVLQSPKEEVRLAFSRPIGSGTLAEEVRGNNTACILICDITRPVPNDVILSALIKELNAASIHSDNISVLVATGLHRPNEGRELLELIGNQWVMNTVRVFNHFARNDGDHVDLGTTTRGTPVKVDRRFVDADIRIAVGLVEPHFVAGYSGGRKVIAPGICHYDTITAFHTARFFEDSRADNCILEDNPLHEDQLEIVDMVHGSLAINCVIDEKHQLSFLNFGEVKASHEDAVRFARKYVEIPISRKFKTVVTSSAGYPLDKTYYQTIKGIVGAKDVLEQGGNLFIVSECSEGMGSPAFVAAQERLIKLGMKGFLEDIQDKRYADVDEWNTELLLRTMRIGDVHLFSEGLSKTDAALTGVRSVASLKELNEAIQESIAVSDDKSIAVIPEGPYDIPVYRPVKET